MAIEDIVAVMPPATWYELPGTNLSAVYAITNPADPRYGVSGPQSVTLDYCGGAFDTDNQQFLLHGGGHNSYAGNEVYGFSLATLAWSVLIPPSTLTNVSGQTWITDDGNPLSIHSYDCLQYLPNVGKMLRHGGSQWEHGGHGNDLTAHLFDTTTNTWSAGANAPTASLTVATAYDPVRGIAYVLGRTALYSYDPVADTWATLIGSLETQTHRVMVYHPETDQLFVLGEQTPNFMAYDCAAGGSFTTITLTGDVPGTYRPGMTYDSTRGTLVLWYAGREVWEITPNQTSSWPCVQINSTSGVAPAPPGINNGTFSKWHYLAAHDAFIGYTNPAGNVWIYKAGTAGSGPAPGWGDPTRRVKLTVPAAALTAAGATGTHTGVPVLIQRTNLPNEMFDPSGASNAQLNGGDIRISLDGQGASRLPLDKVQFTHDSATGAGDGQCALWTRLPTVSDASDTDLYVWYNSATTQVQPLESEPYGRDAVWAGYIGVWHINSATGAADATGQGNDLAISGAANVGSGPFASDPRSVNVDFNATAITPLLALDQDYTFSVIYQRPGAISYPRDQYVLYGAGATSTTKAVAAQGVGAQETDALVYDESGVAQTVHDNSWFVEDTWLWNSIATARGSGEQSFYRNADQQNSITATRRVGTGALQLFSCDVAIWYAEAFIRPGISPWERIKLEHLNQTSPATFFTTDAPVTPLFVGGELAASGEAQVSAAITAVFPTVVLETALSADGEAATEGLLVTSTGVAGELVADSSASLSAAFSSKTLIGASLAPEAGAVLTAVLHGGALVSGALAAAGQAGLSGLIATNPIIVGALVSAGEAGLSASLVAREAPPLDPSTIELVAQVTVVWG